MKVKFPVCWPLYEDSATQRPRAVAMLDLPAICIMSQAKNGVSTQDISQALQSKLVGKAMLDGCQKVLSLSALAFLDSQTRKSLRLKNVSYIPEVFDKLKTLYGKEAGKRIDFACQFGDMALGKVTLVGF